MFSYYCFQNNISKIRFRGGQKYFVSFKTKYFFQRSIFKSVFIAGRGQFCYCYEIPSRTSKMGTLKPVKIRRASRAETLGFLRFPLIPTKRGTPGPAKNRRASRAGNVVKLNQLSNPVGIPTFAIVFYYCFQNNISKIRIRGGQKYFFFKTKYFFQKGIFESAFISGRGQFCYCYEIPLRSSKMGTLKPVKIRRASRAETPGFLRVFADSCQNGYP